MKPLGSTASEYGFSKFGVTPGGGAWEGILLRSKPDDIVTTTGRSAENGPMSLDWLKLDKTAQSGR